MTKALKTIFVGYASIKNDKIFGLKARDKNSIQSSQSEKGNYIPEILGTK